MTAMLSKRPAEALETNGLAKRPRLSDATSESSTGPAAEVAGDFKDSLSELSVNDRFQIQTLTIIAKENTEHAAALSSVLLNHIQKIPPPRKLPALYVLDSIIKNVGTPYTIYLGQNLFKTFWDAYSVVDTTTRRAMESMLLTWKEPIPGSIEQRPVFPVETTTYIERALNMIRSGAEQQKNQTFLGPQRPPSHALPSRPSVPSEHWRNNAPAPSHFQHAQFPPSHQQQPYQQQYGAPSTDYQYGLPQSGYQHHQSPAPPYQQPQYAPPPAQSPMQPPGYQSQYHQPPPAGYIQQFQPPPMRSPQPGYASQYAPPPSQPPYQQSQPGYPPPTSFNQPQPPQPAQPSLAELLRAAGSQPPPTGQPGYHPPPSQHPVPPPPNFSGLGALNQHRVSTPTPHFPTPQPHAPAPVHAYATPPVASASLPGQTPTRGAAVSDAKLTSASLKIPRPGLLSTLYPSLPNSQCTTCGRRFEVNNDTGKERKKRHLDTHFRTNMRMTSALETRGAGASRSWFINEIEWIAYREHDDADAVPETPPEANGACEDGLDGRDGAASIAPGGKGGSKAKAERYITAPSDAALRKQVCPICQEEFSATYHERDQEWVFMDAVKVPSTADGRIYHASCLEEMQKDRGTAATPVAGFKKE